MPVIVLCSSMASAQDGTWDKEPIFSNLQIKNPYFPILCTRTILSQVKPLHVNTYQYHVCVRTSVSTNCAVMKRLSLLSVVVKRCGCISCLCKFVYTRILYCFALITCI